MFRFIHCLVFEYSFNIILCLISKFFRQQIYQALVIILTMRVVVPSSGRSSKLRVSEKRMPILMPEQDPLSERWSRMLRLGVPPSKAKNYYEVRKIVDHRVEGDNGRLSFFVSWKGYGDEENSWVPESHMDGSIELVNDYRLKIGFPPSDLARFAGASDPDSLGRANWVPVEVVLSRIISLSRHPRYNSTVVIKEFREGMALEHLDAIYVAVVNFHVFVILHMPLAGRTYVSDGDNSFLMKEEVRQDVLGLFGLASMEPILFTKQEGMDQCGSSAVLIAVEFLRLYKRNEPIGDCLVVRRGLLDRIKKEFHKYKTEERLTKRESNHLKRPHLKCAICGWGTNATKRQGLSLHMRRVHSV